MPKLILKLIFILVFREKIEQQYVSSSVVLEKFEALHFKYKLIMCWSQRKPPFPKCLDADFSFIVVDIMVGKKTRLFPTVCQLLFGGREIDGLSVLLCLR